MNSVETETMQMVVSGTKFNAADDVYYTKPKINSNSGKNVGILYAKTKKSLYLSTPLMLTWGVNYFEDEKSGKRTYDMSIQFPNKDYPNEDSETFLRNLQALEEKFKTDAITNSKEWMNKPKMSKDVVDALWTPMLRYPKNKETDEPDYTRAPTLRIKIPYWDEKFTCEIYDMDHKKLFPDPESEDDVETLMNLIPKATNVATLIQCGGLWFANGKFGVTWKLFQAVVKPKQTMRGVCHISLSDKDRQEISAQGDDEENKDDTSKVATLVDDSDDDDDNVQVTATVEKSHNQEVHLTPEPVVEAVVEAVVEPVIEPVVAPKKKVVRKKP
jgi:hypothetical protein